MFGLTGNEGNHGEDVKEYYFYLDNVPTHAYMKYLYKYPQRAYPYADLVDENRRRTRLDPEYELLDTGIFEDDRYFDVVVEYAKAGPSDILIRISAANRGLYPAPLHLLPTLWFKNDWSWTGDTAKPRIVVERDDDAMLVLATAHRTLPPYRLYCDAPRGGAVHRERDQLPAPVRHAEPGAVREGRVPRARDRRAQGRRESRAHRLQGSPALRVPGRAPARRWWCACGSPTPPSTLRSARRSTRLFAQRKEEADAFYRRVTPFDIPADMRNVQRQAFAGMLWNKQYYRYMVERWLDGRSRRAQAAEGAQARPQSRLVARRRGRRAVDARQLGIPVVRGVGHGVPHDSASP